jgi:mannose-6-phosphate isomerase-like protein (cupin superfamily)
MTMGYVHNVGLAELAKLDEAQRVVRRLLDPSTGASGCTISVIRTPADGGSPEGLHVHDVDQIFVMLEGMMTVEIDGEEHDLGPFDVVHFPVGVPHRNWNPSATPSVHLSVCAPAPDPAEPFARRV